MLILVAALVLAVTAGLRRGGSLSNLAAAKLAWVPLVVVGFAVQVAARLFAPAPGNGSGTTYLILLSNLVVAAFLFLNRRRSGMVVAMAGQLLNVVVIAANGAMPVWGRAAEIARSPEIEGATVKHEVLDEDTVLPWLGDVIPLPRLGEVISVGDLVLAWGIAIFVYVGMTRVDDGGAPGAASRSTA